MPTKNSSKKVILYVRSIDIPSGLFVDREGAQHACAQAGKQPFVGLKGAANLIGKAYSDADWHAINLIQSLRDVINCDIEIVDISQGFWKKMKLRRQGIRSTPQFAIGEQLLPRITDKEELLHHLQ